MELEMSFPLQWDILSQKYISNMKLTYTGHLGICSYLHLAAFGIVIYIKRKKP